MSRPQSLIAAAATSSASPARKSDSLLPPAIKGVTFGFIGGFIAIVALTMIAPRLMQASDSAGQSANHVGVRR
jgi:hypothetical protein